MVYTIENEQLICSIDSHGCELKSVKDKATGKEYMWNGDPEYWNRTSPVLFPFVGAVRDKKYRHVLYSEHMEMYIEYIHQRFDGKNASVTEMLEYCQLHNIKVIPFPLKKKTIWGYSKLFSKIKAFGCAIDDMELCERITRCIAKASAAAKKREAL